MARIVDTHFDIDGRSEGIVQISCREKEMNGKCQFVIAWDKDEVEESRKISGFLNLKLKSDLDTTLISNMITVSAKDEEISDFQWPRDWEEIAKVFGWKATAITIKYQYRCELDGNLWVISSRGGECHGVFFSKLLEGEIDFPDIPFNHKQRTYTSVMIKRIS